MILRETKKTGAICNDYRRSFLFQGRECVSLFNEWDVLNISRGLKSDRCQGILQSGLPQTSSASGSLQNMVLTETVSNQAQSSEMLVTKDGMLVNRPDVVIGLLACKI